MRRAVEIELTEEERTNLVRLSRGERTQARVVERAKIVLAAANGKSNKQIALMREQPVQFRAHERESPEFPPQAADLNLLLLPAIQSSRIGNAQTVTNI